MLRNRRPIQPTKIVCLANQCVFPIMRQWSPSARKRKKSQFEVWGAVITMYLGREGSSPSIFQPDAFKKMPATILKTFASKAFSFPTYLGRERGILVLLR